MTRTARRSPCGSCGPCSSIVTENAAVNQHMIAINEALGYELLGPLRQSYDLPVALALAAGTPGACSVP